MRTQFRKTICLAAAIWGSNASAGVIMQTHGFDLYAPIHSSLPGGNALDFGNLFDTFDASLGELTAVDVNIIGNLLAVMNIPLHTVCLPACVPIAHTYNLTVNPDFGLSTPGSSFIYNGSGIATSLVGLNNFNHRYSFNETTDLLGFALASHNTGGNATAVIPPTIAAVTLDDFIGPVEDFPLTWLYPSFSYNLIHTSQLPFIGNINLSGIVSLTYHYNEAEEPASVPEPSGMVLLLSGLLMMTLGKIRK